MARCEDVPEGDPRANQDDNQGMDENTQIPQPNPPVPLPVAGDETQAEGYESPAPPPPPEEEEENSEEERIGDTCPSKSWCVFPQRIDTDGPNPEIIWNPGDWELPQSTMQSGQALR